MYPLWDWKGNGKLSHTLITFQDVVYSLISLI